MQAHVKRFTMLAIAAAGVLLAGCSITEHKKGDGSKADSVEIQSPFGSLKVNTDVDPKDTGFTMYPGSRPRPTERGNDSKANVNIDSSLFGLKVVVAAFESDDPPQKVFDYYNPQVRKFGRTLQCKPQGNFGNWNGNRDEDFNCEHGEVTDITSALSADGVELKAGNKNDQHIVAVKPKGSGTEYALVHVQVRKRGDSI
jgi:hypothetical protein